MCKTTDLPGLSHHRPGRDRLLIKGFFLNFSASKQQNRYSFPNSLTLVFPPRLNGSPLDVDGAKINPNSPAFVTLHRIISGATGAAGASYGSTEEVLAGEGVRFEVYFGEEKVVKGSFGKDTVEEWRLECRSGEIPAASVKGLAAAAEVVVAAASGKRMAGMVEMGGTRRKKRGFTRVMEEIPEERAEGSDGCCSSCGEEEEEEEEESDGVDSSGEEEMMGKEMEGVRWAIDVGIWVMCLGVGFLVSKASTRSLRRSRRFLS